MDDGLDGLVMAVVAIDNVRGHVSVKQAGNGLNADKACHEAGYRGKASRAVGPVFVFEVASGLWEHAVERGEELLGK